MVDDRFRWSRRTTLKASVAAAAGIGVAATGSALPARAEIPSDDLLARYRAMLVGEDDADPAPELVAACAAIDVDAAELSGAFVRGADRELLWPDLPFTVSAADRPNSIFWSYSRLQQLAVAYATPGCVSYQSSQLLADLIDGLDWLNEHWYNEGADGSAAWFFWEVGVPLALNATTLLLREELGDSRVQRYMDAVAHFAPRPAMTGANRVWLCMAVAGRAIVTEDPDALAAARDGLSPVFGYVESGDGFYADGSFLQHGRYPYTGGYGMSLLANLSRVLYLLHGSPWQVSDPQVQNVFTWARDAYEPWLFRGSMASPVRGRSISRAAQQDHTIGHTVIAAFVWLAETAPASDREALLGVVKHSAAADTFTDLFDYSFSTTVPGTDLATIARALEAADDPEIPAREVADGTRQFHRMDRMVHRRPDFAFSTAMSSQRIFKYESFSKENGLSWYTGDGVTYLYNSDLAHYDDGYWATVDYTHLPGTTVPAQALTEGVGAGELGRYDWAGGTARGSAGVTGMQFETVGAFSRCYLRVTCDGSTVEVGWSPNGEEFVPVGEGSVTVLDNPMIGLYAARAISDAPVIEARFRHFTLTDGDGAPLPGSDDFEGTRLDTGRWSRIVREDPANYKVTDGALVLPTLKGNFDDTTYRTRNIVGQSAPAGAWQANVVLDFVPAQPYQHAGIVVYSDDGNNIRLHRIAAAGGARFSYVDARDGARHNSANSYPRDHFTRDELGVGARGRKSWFTLDDGIVALGSGIRSSSAARVHTTVENRKLADPARARLIVDGEDQHTSDGWSDTFEAPSWARLDVGLAGAEIGWVFLDGQPVCAQQEARSFPWARVNGKPPHNDPTPLTRHYTSLWLDHGSDPDDAHYAYAILPGASAAQLQAYAADPPQILAHTAAAHAVRSDITVAANIWTEAETTLEEMTCTGPAALLFTQDGPEVHISIADPTHRATGTIRLTWEQPVEATVEVDAAITVVRTAPTLELVADVAGVRGRTLHAHFTRSTESAWATETAYSTGARVTHDGAGFEALWWTRGEIPGTSPWGAWAEVGATVSCTAGVTSAWTDSWIYDEGDVVAHDGHRWQAGWWTRNQEPGRVHGPWIDLGGC